MSDEYVDGIFDGLKELRDIADEMMRLAHSFSAVGNQEVSINLGTMSNNIVNSTKNIQSAVTKELTRKTGGLSRHIPNESNLDEDITDEDVEDIKDMLGQGGGLGG